MGPAGFSWSSQALWETSSTALPVVATLKRRYADIPLDWLIEEEAAPLLAGIRRFRLRGVRTAALAAPVAAAQPGAWHAGRDSDVRRRDSSTSVRCSPRPPGSAQECAVCGGGRCTGARRAGRRPRGRDVGPDSSRAGPAATVHAVARYLALAAAVDARETVRDFTIPSARATWRLPRCSWLISHVRAS